ncbi:SCO family protein [Salinispirillum marinum]|uniref:SCO family protein n=2 Tax=Saccharospirillaceae TaxID=255527 RepID=A0ABV8BHH6_9GAMM
MTRLNQGLMLLVAALLVALAALLLIRNTDRVNERSSVAAPPPGGDFVLTMQDATFQLSDYAGQIVVMYFGYTYCPDVCPTSLAVMNQSIRQLSDEQQAAIVPVFISVDPQRDTPERLHEYAQFFHPRLQGITGTVAELQRVGQQYGVAWHYGTPDESGRYSVDHSSSLYVIDRTGQLAHIVHHDQRPDALLKALQDTL